MVAFESENDRERRLWQNVTRFAKEGTDVKEAKIEGKKWCNKME